MRQTAVSRCNPKRELAALKLVILTASAYVTIGIEVEEAIKSWGMAGVGGRVLGKSWGRGGRVKWCNCVSVSFFHTFYLKKSTCHFTYQS